MLPAKLRAGDTVRVVAPSRSLAIISEDVRAAATRRLEDLGLQVTFGRHVEERDQFDSSAVKSRLEDLHEAFEDREVAGILTAIGGFNSNQLLPEIDYELVRRNPKVLCGFSDITALANAIYARTGLITYSGPHFSSFGMIHHFEWTESWYRSCIMERQPVQVEPSQTWTDDAWYLDQTARSVEPNPGWWILNDGEASGTIVGGNLCTLNLLQGTTYMPPLDDAVLFIEDDALVHPWDFDRDLVSLIQQPAFQGVRGIVIGRFQRASSMTRTMLEQIVTTKRELAHLPVIANADFGHTSPMLTFPIGGQAILEAHPEMARLVLTEH